MKSTKICFCMSFSNNKVPRIPFLKSAKANGVLKDLDFVSIDEKQVTEVYCLIGTSDWFAVFGVFDVSCWSWLHSLNIWVIIIWVGILCTEIVAPLGNGKTISSFEGMFESVWFWDWSFKLVNHFVGVLYIITSNWSFDFGKFSVWWSWISKNFCRTILTNLPDAGADRERGLEWDQYEEIYFLKYCRFLQLDLERER